jgi:hypothetical protein
MTVCARGRVRDRGTVIQKKTGRPVQFEITEQTRSAIRGSLSDFGLKNGRLSLPKPVERSLTCPPGNTLGSYMVV